VSRSALAVAAALFTLGALIWLLTTPGDEPVSTTTAPVVTPAPAGATREPPVPPVAEAARATFDDTAPRITSRKELAAVLKARGLDADKLIFQYEDWRVARGFFDADALAGVGPDDVLAPVYAAMDRATQKSLADSGDLGAIQAYAAGSLPGDPFTAINYYRRASELGSAAAMAALAGVLADLAAGPPIEAPKDPAWAQRLLELRGGDPGRDLRWDASAWTLASIRQYGPMLATPAALDLIEGLNRTPDKLLLTSVCVQSLAILGAMSAATADQDTAALPPVFVAEKDLYARLPCRDTPAPVTPPRALDSCTASPAIGANDRPAELWICREN
jgi:hypothetical protein